MTTCTKCRQHTYAQNEDGECMSCDPSESVDWQARALAAEARVRELERLFKSESRYSQAMRSKYTSELSISNALRIEVAALRSELDASKKARGGLRSLADLALKIGQAKRHHRALVEAERFNELDASFAQIDALLDQAAALSKEQGNG